MESKRTFEFWSELRKHSNNKTSNNNDLLNEWVISNDKYNNCGCRHEKEIEDSPLKEQFKEKYNCLNCICGEKCIYNIYYIENKYNDKRLMIGSKCINRFMNTNFEIYKKKKNEMKKQETILKNKKIKQDIKIAKEKEKKRKEDEEYNKYLKEKAIKKLEENRCEDCLSVLKNDFCYTCKFIKDHHKEKLKNRHFIKWVEDEANKKELSWYIKILYQFINIKKMNEQDIDKLKMQANYEEWIKESVQDMVLTNLDILDDKEYIE